MDYNVDNIESKGEINPTMDTDIVLHKDGKFQRAKIFGFNGKIKPAFVDAVINQTINNNNYTVDPEQIVPSEALYNDTPETLAGDILKRVDKTTGEDVNYRETTTWANNAVMIDTYVDGVLYIKKGSKYYVDTDFIENKTVKISKYVPSNGVFISIQSVFPEVTLSEVQSFDTTANLANSAHWYIISKLLSWLPKKSKIDIDCDIVIDKTIIIKRSSIGIVSSGLKINKINNAPFQSKRVSVKQISEIDAISVIDGDGTRDLLNYVTDIDISDINFFGVYKGYGISLNQTKNKGTAIGFRFKNVSFNSFLCGFKHIDAHINNFYFTDCDFRDNFNIGFELNSDNTMQSNAFFFTNCIFSSNGKQYNGSNTVPYVQDLMNPNYNKGGAKLSGTSIYLNGCQAEVNYGFGIWLSNYLFGGNLTGYTEANVLADFVVENDITYYKNVTFSMYSLSSRYIFKKDEVKEFMIPNEGFIKNKENTLKHFSDNIIVNPRKFTPIEALPSGVTVDIINGSKEFTLPDGFKKIFIPIKSQYQSKIKAIYNVSFDVFVNSGDEVFYLFGIISGGTENRSFNSVESFDKWVRVSFTIDFKNLRSDTVISPNFYSYKPIKVRNFSINKLERPSETLFDYDYQNILPSISDSIATDVTSLKSDFNFLLQKMRDSGLMI